MGVLMRGCLTSSVGHLEKTTTYSELCHTGTNPSAKDSTVTFPFVSTGKESKLQNFPSQIRERTGDLMY